MSRIQTPGLAGAAAILALAHLGFGQSLHLDRVTSDLERPVAIADAGDGSGRLFIVQQTGEIRILEGPRLRAAPFLDLSSLVSCCGERGLLGLAFHPDYPSNGLFFVDYTDRSGDTVIARYRVSSDPNVADAGSRDVLLTIEQPFANHNGGQLAFGPDGNLFVGVGDGGSGGDPQNNAQDKTTLLGSILRLDVDRGLPFTIPEDNPFVSDPTARGEIWAIGLRNPWRFSFDRLTDDLLIADVGQNQWEEVSFEPASSPGGRNYGWRRMEGTHCFDPATNCNPGTLVLPIVEYSHEEGCSITGGFRYRGEAMPDFFGTYFFGDFCSGRIWGATPNADGSEWTRAELLDTTLAISSFGEDEQGELYVADLNGALYRLLSGHACRLELDARSYTTGEPVTAVAFEISNLSAAPTAVAVTLSLRVPGMNESLLGRGGSNGSLVLPQRTTHDDGPTTLFSVTEDFPPGRYAVICRVADPLTGELRSQSTVPFVIR